MEKEENPLKGQILEMTTRFAKEWGKSPSMGFLAGQTRPKVSLERIRQMLVMLEKEGRIKRYKGDSYHRGFEVLKPEEGINENIVNSSLK